MEDDMNISQHQGSTRKVPIIPRKTMKNGQACWLVRVPVDLKGLGPQRKFFRDEKEAKAFCRKLTESRGSPAFAFLDITPDQLTQAVALWRMFDGLTSEQAIQAVALWRAKHSEAAASVAEVVALCLDSKEAAGVRPNSLATLKCTLNNFSASHPCSINAISADQVATWLNRNGWQPKTRLGYLKDVSTLFKFAMKRGMVMSNPCDGVDRPRLDHKSPGIFTVPECQRILASLLETDPALLGYVTPILFGGLRPAESKRMTASNVRGSIIDLSGEQAKGRRRRVVTITPTLARWLAVPGVRFKNVNLVKRIRKLAIRASVKWTHDVLRHSFCSYATTKFGSRQTAEMAGHSEQILFTHYREITSAADADAFWQLSPPTQI